MSRSLYPFNQVSLKLLDEDRRLLAQTRFPIVTLSASFRDVVEKQHRLNDKENHPDIVLSRAHYSMALGIAMTAWGGALDEKKAWLIDPSNYVTKEDWRKFASTELVGRVLARQPFLNWIKQNFIDRFGRKSLPITGAITEPLLFLCQDITRPILSLHIETGNILAPTGKTIVQVVTDPHVRPDYVQNAHLPNMYFCVFDEPTRESFLQVAAAEGKEIDPKRVIVTGPPLDPRVIAAREKKTSTSWRRRATRVLLTTGGLGTNKDELATILKSLLPLTRRRNNAIQILYYAGTNADHVAMATALAAEARVPVGATTDRLAKFRILSADDLVEANILLLRYGFPWADIVYTKPSGDMAYDAAAAGCALLLLEPWGEWERVISSIFQRLNIAKVVNKKDPALQLQELRDSGSHPWLEAALERTRLLPPSFLRGSTNILSVAKKVG